MMATNRQNYPLRYSAQRTRVTTSGTKEEVKLEKGVNREAEADLIKGMATKLNNSTSGRLLGLRMD